MKDPFTSTAVAPADCRVQFGAAAAGIGLTEGRPVLRVALPLLGGAGSEALLANPAGTVEREGCTIFSDGAQLAGFATAPADLDLEAAAVELYGRLFSVTAGRHLYRIWNYVPRINDHVRGLENYQAFCRGRSLAFERRFGRSFQRVLPSASAVGAVAGPLAIGFVAGLAEPRHFENPSQVPAFEYPREYGPRPPSFSRATVIGEGNARQIFISGTAAIRGHATVAAGDVDGQLTCTLENLALVGQAAGVGSQLGGPGGWRRTFKVYLRHASDFPRVRARLDRELLGPDDTVSCLQADICRAELLVEIEAALAAAA
jgi:hypothetical protein